jgi:Tol biopolymer transport system component
MPLGPGTRLGPFEVVAAIGAGGMGEVYRARDTQLKREVAIKVLPEAFAGDPERLARFQREAELLATLNHPNIAAVYGLEKSDGLTAIVLELVDGDTLADAIARGPLMIDDALKIARQIADALEAAHEKGVIHRDLKPANIKVTPAGQVKVLDFGLAKLSESAGIGQQAAGMPVSMSPTLSVHATYVGVILGTAAYMSPEQARGKPVDRGTDIWSYGCVLFEMLTGRQTFQGGETVSDAIAAVLKNDPDWSALPADTPPHIRTLLRRCLQKDPQKRLPHIGVARIEIDEGPVEPVAGVAPIAPPRSLWRRALPLAATAILAVALTGIAAWSLKPPVQPPTVTRFPIVLPDDQRYGGQRIAVSPDGNALAYVTTGVGGGLRLRSMAQMDARSITDGVSSLLFFSPDGQWIAYWSASDQALKKVAITGGAAVTICKATVPFGVAWEGDRILFGQAGKGILRVSADGGEPEVLVPVKLPEIADTPQLLDGGKAVLFTLASGRDRDRWDKAQIVVQILQSGERRVVLRGGSSARYLPTGHLVYALGEKLLAVPFDLETLQVRGGPVPVIEDVRRDITNINASSFANFDVSASGTLAYVRGGSSATGTQQLTLVDRSGKRQSLPLLPPLPAADAGVASGYSHPRFSPDGRQLVYDTDDGKESIVWVFDLKGSGPPRRLTFGGQNSEPLWTPDGRITFRSRRDDASGIFWQPADGTGIAELLVKAEAGVDLRPEAWTPDGRTLAFMDSRQAGDIWTLTLGDGQKPKPLVQTLNNERYAAFSPNGRWFGYSEAQLGAVAEVGFHVFVQPFPPTGAKYEVSTGPGRNLVWSPDGKQLFYVDGSNRMVTVDIRTEPSFSFGKSVAISVARAAWVTPGTNYDISPDGKRFILVLTDPSDPASRPNVDQINVVLSWFEELKARVPTK